jgi:hypothetical protein
MKMTNNLKYNRLSIICLLIILCINKGYAQKHDLELWTSLNERIPLYKELKLTLTEESRFNNNISSLKQLFVVGELSYDIKKRLSISSSYKFRKRYKDDETYNDNILNFNVSYDLKFKRFTLKSRSRYEYGKEEDEDNETVTNTYFREKFTLNYDIYKTALTPYASFEWYSPTKGVTVYKTNAYRWFLGLKYPYKNNKFSIAYGVKQSLTGKRKTKNIISVEYLYKF